MKVLHSTEEAAAALAGLSELTKQAGNGPTSVTTWGNFDGVHLGHQALIGALVRRARALGLPSVVMTFEPRPAVFFNSRTAPKAVADLDDKLALLASLGVDFTLVQPFNHEVSDMEPEEFLRVFPVESLGAKALVLGYDPAFGRNRGGDIQFLRSRSAEYGYELEQVPPLYLNGRAISSTWVREELSYGKLEVLPALLGRQHSVHGIVQHGFKRGRSEVGFATANLDPGPLLLPPNGVYACLARCQGEYCAAACNLGRNPSFGTEKVSLEAHLLDFYGEIYGTDLRIYFVERLRSERIFDSPEDLGRQIGLDVRNTRDIIGRELVRQDFAARYPL